MNEKEYDTSRYQSEAYQRAIDEIEAFELQDEAVVAKEERLEKERLRKRIRDGKREFECECGRVYWIEVTMEVDWKSIRERW